MPFPFSIAAENDASPAKRGIAGASSLGAGALATILILLAAAMFAWPAKKISLHDLFTPEHVDLLEMTDTRAQQLAHKVLLMMVAFVVVARASVRRALDHLPQPAWNMLAASRRWFLAGAGLLVLTAATYHRTTKELLCMAVVLILMFSRGSPKTEHRLGIVATVGLLGYAAFLLLLPLGRIPDLSEQILPFVECHFGMVVSEGDRLAQGLRLFHDVTPHYGFLTPMLLAIYERAVGMLNFGQHIRVIQTMQVIFAILVFVAYFTWSRGEFLPSVLASLLVLPWIHVSFGAIYYPNQSAWRSMGLPIGALTLIAGTRLTPKGFARLAGVTFGVLFLLNPETALAVCAGFCTVILFRSRGTSTLRGRFGVWVDFAFFAVLPLGLFAFTFQRLFGYYPFPDLSESGRTTLARVSRGYAGLPISLSLGFSWMVVLIHSLFELIRAALSPVLCKRGQVRAGFAAVILVWFAYLFNRFHEWNYWTFIFLYGFFIIDLVSRRARLGYGRALRKLAVPTGAAAVILIFGSARWPHLQAINKTLSMYHTRRPPGAEMVSGVWLRDSDARLVVQKAQVIAGEPRADGVFYFTADSYLVPLLSGVFPALPACDVFAETVTPADYQRLLARVLAAAPARLFFDDPGTNLSGSDPQRHFFARLRLSLATQYQLFERRDGWEIWQRRLQTSE